MIRNWSNNLTLSKPNENLPKAIFRNKTLYKSHFSMHNETVTLNNIYLVDYQWVWWYRWDQHEAETPHTGRLPLQALPTTWLRASRPPSQHCTTQHRSWLTRDSHPWAHPSHPDLAPRSNPVAPSSNLKETTQAQYKRASHRLSYHARIKSDYNPDKQLKIQPNQLLLPNWL